MTKKTALKPCPFCGEKRNIRVMSAGTKSILCWVCCNKCFAVSGAAELCHCRKCGRKVHMEFGKRGYKYIRCLCGNSMQAKVTAEEMICRWNNRVPAKSILWKCK